MPTLLDAVSELVSPELVSQAAGRLGEPESSVSRGMLASLATFLAALANKAGDSGLMSTVFDMARRFSSDPATTSPTALLQGVTTTSTTPSGPAASLLGSVFGGRTTGISDLIARDSGLRPASASGLLSMAAPLVLGLLGRRAQQDGLDATGLASMLASQRGALAAALPAGLGSLIGGAGTAMPRLDSAFDTARRTVPVAAPRGRGWLVPTLVGLAAVLLLGFWAARRRPVETVSTGTTVPADTTRAVPAGMVSETLPGGATLIIPATGIESRLVTFIKDPAAKVSDTVWFDFDRLLFETGSATLKPESQDQLGLVAQILQAYPNVKARVGGYTDNVGNPSANVRLSQARATNVVQALEAKGVAAGRLDAKGYGAEHPVADNATEAGRAQNRRIALRVTAK